MTELTTATRLIEREELPGATVVHLVHGKVNAVDLELAVALVEELAELAEAPTPAVVLTGRGSAFSAGVDLHRLLNGGRGYISQFLPALSDAIEAIYTFPKPIVAATNGHAIAAGCVMVAACDYRLMAKGRGRIGVPELLVGVPFLRAGIELLRTSVAPQRLSEVAFRGTLYGPENAREIGLVDELADADQLVPRAVEVAEELSRIPAATFRMSKMDMRRSASECVQDRAVYFEELVDIWAADETLDAVRAYVQRTIPRDGNGGQTRD